MLVETAIEIVKSSPRNSYESGVDAMFKRIDERWGLKFYRNERMRDKTYDFQGRAAELGYAPILGDKVDFTTSNGGTVYGYITECVARMEERDGYGDYPSPYMMNVMHPEYENLIEGLGEIMYVQDMHGGNVGWMADGRMVAIDFGHCEELEECEDD